MILGEQFFQIRVIFEIQLSWEVKTVSMVDQQDRFYREVLELSRNNTSKQNVFYTKWKSRWSHRQGSSCKDCLKVKWSGKTFVEEIRCHASFRNARADTKTIERRWSNTEYYILRFTDLVKVSEVVIRPSSQCFGTDMVYYISTVLLPSLGRSLWYVVY